MISDLKINQAQLQKAVNMGIIKLQNGAKLKRYLSADIKDIYLVGIDIREE